MTMDAKDLRIESALGAHNDDGNTKYAQSGTTFQSNVNKPYHDIGSNSLAKVDVPAARPCAIIGPDRVVPPQSTNDAYAKKVPVEPWQYADNIHQHPPEYPHKPTEYQLSRNISPRQTFQENMQRIMVPPTFASVKNNDEHCLKNPKVLPPESKFCDVSYTINPVNNEPKIIKSSDGLVLNNSYNQPVLPHGWASSGVNVRPLRPYGAPDLYQYSEYANCPGPRPISMIRPHRNVHEEVPQAYQDRFHEANIRYKPYPSTKERPLQNPHSRYDYVPNYPNTFPPHVSYPAHKYELQKSLPTHPYSVYPSVPLKYLERRMPVPTMEKYPHSPNQQTNLNQPFCNPNMPSTYGPLPGNCLQNRAYPYVADPGSKNMIQNRLYFDNNSSRKYYTSSENMFTNDMNRPPAIKTDLMYPSYPHINIHALPPHHMYRKETSMKAYEHALHYRNIEYSTNINPLGRVPLQFSPQTMSISPSDSNTSNDTTQILGNAQDDCGYVSQSSTASIRSVESGVNRISNDIYRRQDMSLPNINKFAQKVDNGAGVKDKKSLNVRQFLQMWNEGEDEGSDNNKEPINKRDSSTSLSCYESGSNQEQLYVLGLVNVPKEELGKYEHIQKISKLPENIKGYNSIELLNQYEKLVESPVLSPFSLAHSQPRQKDLHIPIRTSFPKHGMEVSNAAARPLSPLDVEAKISQSVIHKEVGCNFEIRPCSPQMMNVNVATPVHNLLGERLIEKVVNPVKSKSPSYQGIEKINNISSSKSSPTSCKMISNPSPNLNESLKTNYCLQDLESNSGVCLASLPRLDNDIELNFPEINQQFINDNKMSSIRDLPILDNDNTGNAHNSKAKIHNHPLIIEHPTSGSDSDKDVSKLSKFRKQKRYSITNDNEDTLNMSLHRTDSVIIKNPENVKSQEECINNLSMVNYNTPSIENVVHPLAISVESDQAINYSEKKCAEIMYENCNDYKSRDSDTAIDFSLNKCDEIHSNNINSLGIISDGLNNNNEIDTEVLDKVIGKVCSPDLPKQLEVTASDDTSVTEAKSPTLDDITCSTVLDDKVVLQSSNDDIDIIQSHESVITHSKSQEIMSLTEETESQNDLPLLNECNDNTSPNMGPSSVLYENVTSLRSNIQNESVDCSSEKHLNDIVSVCEPKGNSGMENINVTALRSDIENEAINGSPEKHPNDIIVSVCEPNSGIENVNDLNIVKHTDFEGTPILEKELKIGKDFNIISHESIAVNDTQKFTDANNITYDLKIQDSKDEKITIVQVESEVTNGNDPSDIKETSEICNTDVPNDQNSNTIDTKIHENDDFNHKESDKSYPEIKPHIGLDCISHTDNKDLTHIAINDFCLTNNQCPKIDVKDDTSLTKSTEIISEDLSNELKISPILNDNSNTELLNSHAETYQSKYKVTFNKKLFSPRIQNLLFYHEGSCTSVRSSTNIEDSSSSFEGNDHCLQPTENLKDSVETYFEEFDKDPQGEYNTNNHGIIKDHESLNTVTSDKSIEYGTTTVEGTCNIDSVAVNIVTSPLELQKPANIEISHDEIQSEIVVLKRKDQDPVIEVPDEESHSTISANNIEIADKIHNCVDEKTSIHLTWDQLANKRRTLKRSLSESAVTEYTTEAIEMKNYDNSFKCSRKRQKMDDSEILVESQVLNENFTSFVQNNRRNSVSTIYNDDNVSFCILIDNDCVITQDNESCQKICYTEIPDECLTTICTEGDAVNCELTENICFGDPVDICSEEEAVESELTADIYYGNNVLICGKGEKLIPELDSEKHPYEEPELCPGENQFFLHDLENRTTEDTWVEDVACMETVFNDDIAEDIVISAPSSPKDLESSEEEGENIDFVYNINVNEHTNKVKHIYGHQMCDNDAELVEKLYRTPQMNVNQTLIDRDSQLTQEYSRYYDNESLEKILSESNNLDTHTSNESKLSKSLMLPSPVTNVDSNGNKENLQEVSEKETKQEIYPTLDPTDIIQTELSEGRKFENYDDCLVHSCESSCDNPVSLKKDDKVQYSISSSPEVSSTTSEEKGPAILLKIRSYKGSKVSEVNEMSASFNHSHSHRPLITKAAQKYIPPLKETIHDLKVKIRLPKQSLYKLQQLKESKEKPKIDTNCTKLYIKKISQETLKKVKPKPKFEDVLMSIDEIQFKKHKIKNRKNKQSVPKVIIKKNENGAHYASTRTKDTFNPDLTGRKWQPWVFLEKSHFVDKMALKQKFKAIYSHRKKTFVLAENFQKYKSISNAKFVITHPKPNDNLSTGNLKYTFRLKHS